MQIACPICRARHPEGTRTCTVCGHDLTALHLVVCPICGALNPADDERCRRCAIPLREPPAPPTLPETPAAESGDSAKSTPSVGQEAETTREHRGTAPETSAAELPARQPGPAIPLDPLAGLTAPLGLARAAAEPHRATLRLAQEFGDADHYDADLLAQIAAEPAPLTEGAHRVAIESYPVLPRGWRIVLYMLVLAAALLPWVLPGLGSSWIQPRPAVVALAEAVADLPEKAPVLLVWDYDARYAGELDPLASALLAQLLERQAAVEVVAMSPASLGQAQRVISVRWGGQAPGLTLLGYIPIGEAGWRLLAEGAPTVGIEPASDYALVVLLADGAAAVRGWVEQVEVYSGASPYVLVTARSEPSLWPYVQSGQLRAVLGGAWAAPEFEVASGQRADAVATASGYLGLALVIAILAVLAMLRGPRSGRQRGSR